MTFDSSSENSAGPHPHPTAGRGDRAAETSLLWSRLALGVLIVLIALAYASLLEVRTGEAMVVTRFGNPMRVLTQPGLAWRWPAPIELALPVDLRLHTTSSGLHDVGTKDGLRVIMQAFVAWQVQPDRASIERFVRAVRNDPDEAAAQTRSFVGSALETVTSAFDLASLINTDPAKVRLDAFESDVRTQIAPQLLQTYGIRVVQLGVQSLTLPAVTLDATVQRMRVERETIATQRTAAGRQQAAEIRATAERDARILKADASVKAADIEAAATAQAAGIYGKAHAAWPELYDLLRSVDTLGTIITPDTRLVLRTDAAPFRSLVEGPPTAPAGAPRIAQKPAPLPAAPGAAPAERRTP